jgi:hypothetical protein
MKGPSLQQIVPNIFIASGVSLTSKAWKYSSTDANRSSCKIAASAPLAHFSELSNRLPSETLFLPEPRDLEPEASASTKN